MKKFRLVLWFAVIIIIQTSATHYIKVFDAVPVFILPFTICIMLLEKNFNAAAIIGAVCGACAGSFLGRNFFLSAALITLSSLAVFFLKNSPRYMSDIRKAVLWTAVVTFIWETLSYGLLYHSFLGYSEVLLRPICILVVYNSLISLILYPLIKKNLYKYSEGQTFLVNK